MQSPQRPRLRRLRPDQAEALRRLREDPVEFGLKCLGRKPLGYTPGQVQLLRAIAARDLVTVPAGHNVGKTASAADLVIWWLTTRRPSKVLVTAPTERQVGDHVWAELRKSWGLATVPLGLPAPYRSLLLRVDDDHFARGAATKDPNSLQGLHSPHLLVVVDEAQGVPRHVWDQIRGLCSSRGSKILAIGNPADPEGPFFEACQSPEWVTVRLDCLEHPNVVTGQDLFPGMVSREWVDRQRREYGEESRYYQARVRGIFPTESTDKLIPLAWVQRAEERQLADGYADPVIAVDVARFGSNETAVVLLLGGRMVELRTWQGWDLVRTVEAIMRLKAEHRFADDVPVVVDDDGLGGGVVDVLAVTHGQRVIRFRGGLKARDETRFVDARSEAWWLLREALQEERLSLLADEKLRAQLVSMSYRFPAGRIRATTKDELARKGIPSPDRADALIMAWWWNATGPAKPPADMKPGRRPPDWRRSFKELSGLA